MFDWDATKAASNILKHDVSFEEAATADSSGLDGPDLGHSQRELRFIRIGRSSLDRVLTIAYTIRRKDHATPVIRIISARRASRKETRAYEKSD